MLSKCLDFMFASAVEKPDDILYTNHKEESKDLSLLIENIEYHEPANKEEHTSKIQNVLNGNKYTVAVASKAIAHDNFFLQIMTGIFYAGYYKCARQS